MWFCECKCGGTVVVTSSNLKTGNTKSCGCWSHGKPRHGHTTHRSVSSEYATWSSMKQRCLDVAHSAYASYGGRGISVCERWLVFENFLADMGPRPSGRSLDRIDNDGNYEPSNCRWATAEQQCNNRRNNTRFDFNGKSLTLPQWSRELGIEYHTLKARRKRGLTGAGLFRPVAEHQERIHCARKG